MDKIPLIKRKTPLLDRLKGFRGQSRQDNPPTGPTEEADDEEAIELATRQLGKGDVVRVLISYKKSSYEGRVLTAMENQGYGISPTFKPYVNQIIRKIGKQLGVQ
jgi:hypothetical protein